MCGELPSMAEQPEDDQGSSERNGDTITNMKTSWTETIIIPVKCYEKLPCMQKEPGQTAPGLAPGYPPLSLAYSSPDVEA